MFYNQNVVILAQLCEYSIKQQVINFEWMNFIVYKLPETLNRNSYPCKNRVLRMDSVLLLEQFRMMLWVYCSKMVLCPKTDTEDPLSHDSV